jgi:hypothetical protein
MTAKTPSPFKFPLPLYGYLQAEVSTQGGNNQSRRHLIRQIRTSATKGHISYVSVTAVVPTGFLKEGSGLDHDL